MARVKIEPVIEHLRMKMRRALEAAIDEVQPNLEIDSHDLYRAFRRAIRRKCQTWESVPDQYVEQDE